MPAHSDHLDIHFGTVVIVDIYRHQRLYERLPNTAVIVFLLDLAQQFSSLAQTFSLQLIKHNADEFIFITGNHRPPSSINYAMFIQQLHKVLHLTWQNAVPDSPFQDLQLRIGCAQGVLYLLLDNVRKSYIDVLGPTVNRAAIAEQKCRPGIFYAPLNHLK